MPTAYATHTSFAEHDIKTYQHPEHAGRIQAVWQTLDQLHLTNEMLSLSPAPLDRSVIELAHAPQLLDMLERIAHQEKTVLIDHDTYATPASYEIARWAAGAAVQVTEAVLKGEANNGLVAVRPPGHHATINKAMGFCLLNNIAIAARIAQTKYQLKRILIVDYDVHHGNGTQDIFYDDPGVLFISTHQSPFYPGSGHISQTGKAEGHGYTLNIPMPAGQGDINYAAVFEQIVIPAAQRYQPQLILVSAGFDAHWHDPLANMKLSLVGYNQLTRQLIELADGLCDGKIVFVMEGGYDLQALSHGIANIAYALLGRDDITDPYGPAIDSSEPDIAELISQIRRVHQLEG